jgi:hypothetical protein
VTEPTPPAENPPSEDRGPSGAPAVDAASERLTSLDDAPLEEHVEIFEDVHRQLQEGLADLDER